MLKLNRIRRSHQGFTLIEVLVAVALLALLGVAFFTGLSAAFKSNVTAETQTTAMTLAQMQMESLQDQDYIEASSGGVARYILLDLNTLDTDYSSYAILSQTRDGSLDSANIIGIPWDSQSDQAVTEDAGLQKITLVIRQNSKSVLTLSVYKVEE